MPTRNKHAKMRVLFISRAYPPVVGGIENQNYELSQWLPKITPTRTIANTHGKKVLPFFFIYLFFILPFIARRYDVILLGDGVLSIVAWWMKFFVPDAKIACIVHGLDITYKNTFYQKMWVGKFLPLCDKLIAVGNYTITEGIRRNIPQERFVFIPNGVHVEKFIHYDIKKDAIFSVIGNKWRNKKILLTFGRLAQRKGVAWFIRNVLPQLPPDIIYIVAGDGPDKQNISTAIDETQMNERVIMLGFIDDTTREKILAGADIFIQPNIPINGDVEGFGIVVIEAGASGLTVLASDLEGLRDAITDGKNGFLVPSQNTQAWHEKIINILSNDFDRELFGKNARIYVQKHFHWQKIAQRYYEILRTL